MIVVGLKMCVKSGLLGYSGVCPPPLKSRPPPLLALIGLGRMLLDVICSIPLKLMQTYL